MNSILLFEGRPQAQRQRRVLIALAPVMLGSAWLFGYQMLVNIACCVLFGVAFEALARLLRRLPGRDLLRDEHTALLACLLGLSLPPATPWWQFALGMGIAVLLVKHAYGGVGQYPFHPSMVAVLLLWLSFPESAQHWPVPYQLNTGYEIALTSTASDPSPWLWLNLLALAGGIYLLLTRAIAWQIPVGVLVALALLPLLIEGPRSGLTINDSLTQLFYGATMLTAFFIATDPASSAMTRVGKLLYGLLIGSVLFSIRLWGELPEGYAAAVVLANFLAPLLDRLVSAPYYGHGRKGMTASPRETE